MSYDIANIPEEMKLECKALYLKYPDIVKGLINYPDPIGKMVKICISCGT